MSDELVLPEEKLPELPQETEIPAVGELSVSERAQLLTVMDKILNRLDLEPQNTQALEMFERVIAMHGEVLKQTSPVQENKRPERKSFRNPEGERDHPTPKLVRPVFFLGSECRPDEMFVSEVKLANQITQSVEVDAPNGRGKWVAQILRDQAGKESLYLSVPFTGFDDIRGISLQMVLERLTGSGTATIEQNSYASRIQDLLASNEAMAARLAALEQAYSNRVQ